MSKIDLSYNDFLNFLESENIDKLFKHYLNHNLGNNIQTYFQRKMKNKDEKSLITSAFIWADTKEGPTFWQNINIRFIKYKNNRIRKLKLNKLNGR